MSALLDDILAPITAEKPFGESINFDIDFDAVKNEIGKLGSLDYELIETKSKSILKDKAKDIRIFAFLSFALVKSEKWEEFADVIDGFTQLAEKDYDGLFPERPRAKELALKWMSEDRYKDLIQQKTAQEKDYDHLARCSSAFIRLKKALEPKFPEGSPFPAEIAKKISQLETSTKPKPKPVPAAAGAAGTSASPSGAVGVSGAPAEEPMETPKQAQGIARKAGRFLIEKEPLRLMGYRIMRSIRWDLFEKTPPAEGGKTQLTGPNEQQCTYFSNLITQKEWKTLFDKSEEAFASATTHLWLNLMRYQAMAAKELGDTYVEVRRAIIAETRLFVERIPEIVNLNFSDGTPFADDATKQWINEEVKSSSGGGNAGAPVITDPLVAEEKQVTSLCGANQFDKALEFLQAAMRSSSSESQNFKRQLLMAKTLLKAKQPDIALSILETLDDKTAEYHLDKWDPDLAVDTWGALVMAIKVAKANKPQNTIISMTEKQMATLKKVSQISPQKALELNR